MKQIYSLLTVLLPWCVAPAQPADYWQQEVAYRIDVHLDDSLHLLRGTLDLQYTNNAPDTLDFIWFHLWPNAYRDQTTAFAQQQSRIISTRFYFAKDNELGFIDSLDFRVNDRPARLEYHPDHADMAQLWLPASLLPGEAIHITTPFRVKIPHVFSRLGHEEQAYQISQWYPKPAVYDAAGWHPMPYLDQGEFYSEFGSYEVSITLPENYRVGATGQLQNAAERSWLLERAAETRRYFDQLPHRPNGGLVIEDFPPSSPQLKTINYTAEGVHDFAWFADKRYRVLYDTLVTSAGATTDIWTFFTATEEQLWRHSADYVKRALAFYSERVGPYPYPQMTAVQGALEAGGGMEYPMITVIDLAGNARNLDEVIAHEVGHNWFYGMLASNERDHPWLDEGLNSFYEQRYMQHYHPPAHQWFIPEFVADRQSVDLSDLLYQNQSRQGRDQAPDTPSDALSSTNYWLSAYYKPARALWHLYHYWGEATFDRAMQTYYRAWRFRHPRPADFRTSLYRSASDSLHWLFDGLLYSGGAVDYAVNKISKSRDGYVLTISNRGGVAAPVPIYGLRGDEIVYEDWLPGFMGTRQHEITFGQIDRVVIDHGQYTPDINRKNNSIETQGAFRKLPPFRMPVAVRLENEQYTSLYWLPIPGWNAYDGLQFGLLLHNHSFPGKQLEFDLLPMFGLRSKSINGIGNIDYRLYPNSGLFREITLGLNYRSFHYRENAGESLRYQRWQPAVELVFRNDPAATFSHRLQYRMINLSREVLNYPPGEVTPILSTEADHIHEWSYAGQNDRILNPFRYQFTLEQQSYTDVFERPQRYLKWSIDWSGRFHFDPDRAIHLRLFAGGFLENTRRRAGAIFPGAFSLIDQAAADYRFDDFYFGRSARDGFPARQLTQRDGGFKTPVNPAFNLGKSNNFIAAVNLKADWPFGAGFPVRPYLDLGYFSNAMPAAGNPSFSDQFLASAGIAVEILDGRCGLYFPLLNTRNIQDRLAEGGNFWQRIAFRFDLYGEELRRLQQYE